MAVLTYKCPNCDGGLIYDPQSGSFRCEYCNSVFTQSQLDEMAPAQSAAKAEPSPDPEEPSGAEQGAAAIYTCPSCGAEVACDATTAATICYYCHNPVVVSGRLEGAFLPDLVVPFAIDRDSAVKLFLDDVSRRWFVPRDFFSKREIDSLAGVYFPHWIVDSDIEAAIDGQGTTVRVWRTGDVEYTETRFFDVRRAGRIRFEELMKNALKSENRRLVEGVLPFDCADARSYSPGYLQGFQAQKRDTEADELRQEVTEELTNYARQQLKDTASGYSTLILRESRASVADQHWRYALLPVWVLAYRARDGRLLHFAINGQNGKMCGKLPLDKGRLAALFAGVSAVLFALMSLMGGYLR